MATKSCSPVGQANTQHSISTLPFDRDKGFVGREKILTTIERRLLVESRVAIAGIGGVGSGLPYSYLCSLRRQLIFLDILENLKSLSSIATDSKKGTLEAACFGCMLVHQVGSKKHTK